MKQWAFAGLLATLATIPIACSGGGGGGGSSAPPANVSGSWIGSIQSSTVGSGTTTLIVYQGGFAPTGGGSDDPSEIHGLWSSDFAGTDNDNGGTFTGTVIEDVVNAFLVPFNSSACPFDLTARLGADGRIAGVYVAVQCSAFEDGSFSIRRRSYEELGFLMGEENSGWVRLPDGTEGQIAFFLWSDGQGGFTGDFLMTFEGDAAVFNSSGALAGGFEGFEMNFTVLPPEPNCALEVQGSLWNNLDAGRPWFEGTLRAINCAPPFEAVWRVEYRGPPVREEFE